MLRVISSVLVAFALCARGAASAEPLDVMAAATVDFLTGKHETGGDGVTRLDFVPLPLLELDARLGPNALHVEGLPSVTFAYGGNATGAQATRLGIITVTARRRLSRNVFIGAGQTVYNQHTFYPPGGTPVGGFRFATISAQASRVTGLRFESGLQQRVSAHTALEVTAAVNPVMHGVEYSTAQYRRFALEVSDSEQAAQVDLSARITTRAGRGDVIAGIRYLNYTARFRAAGTPADGLLSDRNVGYLPLIGYRFRL